MSKEKQIEGMAKVIKSSLDGLGCGNFNFTGDEISIMFAEHLYNENYRKQSKWISVEERLPERAEDYICRCIIKDNFDYPFYMILRYILIDENPHFQHECENG